jgi:uncharacterized protein
MLKLNSLFTYPIKGMGGNSLKKAKLTPKGFEHDRRWMLTDLQGNFLSQRELPQLALYTATVEHDQLFIRLRQMNATISTPISDIDAWPHKRMVQVWSSRTKAEVASQTINQWLSDYLKREVILVHMPDTTKRSVPPHYAGVGQTVSYADAYPYLITSMASLNDLNRRLTHPVPMDRFRANIVVEGSELVPWEEDLWKEIQINGIAMRCVKPCARCQVITTDQNTGERNKEPLATLATFRKSGNKVLFGQNTILSDLSQQGAWLEVGDELIKDSEE